MTLLEPGQVLGAYTILELLGKGGMGAVYKARDAHGLLVAIKVLAPELCRDTVALERFLREARAVAALSHPHVTKLIDIGKEGKTRFLVLEYVPGGTAHARMKQGALPWKEVASIGAKIASALAAVHEAGLIHRDVKPANILLDEKGEPKLADFGLVKSGTSGGPGWSLTRTGEFVGTLEFLAPEQANATGNVDERADLYSLGATLYALATARYPFTGTGYALVKKHLTERPAPPRSFEPDLPERLEAVILRLLEKDPEARGTAAETARELGMLAREGTALRKGRPLLVVAAFLGGLVAVGGAVALGTNALGPDAPEPVATRSPSPVATRPKPTASPSPARASIELARSRLRSHDLGGALAAASRAVELDPGLAEAWLERANVRSLGGSHLEAVADANHAIELDPRLARAFALRAEILLAGKPEEALADANHALELDPGLVQALYVRSVLRCARGELDLALADANRALELDPRSADALRARASVFLRKGESSLALADLDRAIQLDPFTPQGWRMRADLRLERHDREGATADLDKALELHPDWPSALAMRGRVRSVSGDTAGAEADLERALAVDPDCVDARIFRAFLRLQARDLDGAIADLSRAIEILPQDDRPWVMRADARRQKGDFAGAIDDLTKGIERNPKNAPVWVARAGARVSAGDPKGAAADYRHFLELAPDDPSAERIRARIAELEGR